MTEQAGKPLHTWRPMAAAVVGLLVGLAAGAAICFPLSKRAARPPEFVPPPVPGAVAAPPGLAAAGNAPVVYSSDWELAVWNHNSHLGGSMPDIVNTLRWYDNGQRRDSILDMETGSLGWVEGIATIKTSAGPVYVLISERKSAATCYSTRLTAFRIGKGQRTLQDVRGFFPSMPGVTKDGASVEWEYYRQRGDEVFPRPFEVRIDEQRQCLRVWVFPEACVGVGTKSAQAEPQQFELVLADGKLSCRGLTRAALDAMKATGNGVGGDPLQDKPIGK